MADPVFANIPAVRAGRVAFLGPFTTEFAGTLAAGTAAPILDAALTGQPQGA